MKISVNIKPIVMKNQNKDALVTNIMDTFGLGIDDNGSLFRFIDGKVQYFGVVFHKQRVKAKNRKYNQWTAQIYIIDESMLYHGIRITQHARHFEITNA